MTKRLLDVGNCSADHGAIRALVAKQFGAEIVQADTSAEALAVLRGGSFDLVTVNRVFDHTSEDGLALIRSLKADPSLAGVPVMLITNYPDHARSAIELGAASGFGKRELHSAATREKLAAFLAE